MYKLRTFKSMEKFMTQKTIKEGIEKQEFFEEVIAKMKIEFTKEEHQFFILYLNRHKKRNVKHSRSNIGSRKKTKQETDVFSEMGSNFSFTKVQEDIICNNTVNQSKKTVTEYCSAPIRICKLNKSLKSKKDSNNKTCINQALFLCPNSSFQSKSLLNTTTNISRSRVNESSKKDFRARIPIKLNKLTCEKQQQTLRNSKVLEVYRDNFMKELLTKNIHSDSIDNTILVQKQKQKQNNNSRGQIHKFIRFSPKIQRNDEESREQQSNLSSLKYKSGNEAKSGSLLKVYFRKF